MTRREFLQFAGGSVLILFGMTNLLAMLNHFAKTADSKKLPIDSPSTGFGTRKFGA